MARANRRTQRKREGRAKAINEGSHDPTIVAFTLGPVGRKSDARSCREYVGALNKMAPPFCEAVRDWLRARRRCVERTHRPRACPWARLTGTATISRSLARRLEMVASVRGMRSQREFRNSRRRYARPSSHPVRCGRCGEVRPKRSSSSEWGDSERPDVRLRRSRVDGKGKPLPGCAGKGRGADCARREREAERRRGHSDTRHLSYVCSCSSPLDGRPRGVSV